MVCRRCGGVAMRRKPLPLWRAPRPCADQKKAVKPFNQPRCKVAISRRLKKCLTLLSPNGACPAPLQPPLTSVPGQTVSTPILRCTPIAICTYVDMNIDAVMSRFLYVAPTKPRPMRTTAMRRNSGPAPAPNAALHGPAHIKKIRPRPTRPHQILSKFAQTLSKFEQNPHLITRQNCAIDPLSDLHAQRSTDAKIRK